MSSKKTLTPTQAEALGDYEKLVATAPGVDRKGDTMPYTSVNGNMFSVLHKDGVVGLRLPAEVREAFIKKYSAHLVESYGVVQKEYVAVPPGLLKDTKALRPYFEQSVAYARSLKPKPTTRGGAKKGGGSKNRKA